MSKTLSFVTATLSSDARAFRDNSLELSGADETELTRIGRLLQTIHRVQWWWWGDYLNEMFRRMLASDKRITANVRSEAAVNPRLLTRLRCKWLTEYSVASGMNYQTLSDYMQIADFYAPLHRIAELTPTHHHEARLASCDNLPTALKWLKRALSEGWTAADIRAAMRKALTTDIGRESTEPQPDGLKVAELAALKHWVNVVNCRIDRHEIESADAELILHELQPAEELASKLRTLIDAGSLQGAHV